MDPCELTILEARTALAHGELSCGEYVDALLARATACRGLNALAAQDADALRTAAGTLDRSGAAQIGRRALEGIPIALKDNIDTAALPTTGGTGALAGRRPPRDAPVAQRLFAAGALLAGKTNMHELAFGITCNNAVTGAVRNPWDPERIPGGSSGGSAAAVAARMVPAALGTDTGASVRLPAALCGVVGFRPTVGRYPGRGVIPISHTRDTVGPITRSVADTLLLDAVLAGSDESPPATADLRGLRFGVARRCFFSDLDADVAPVIEAALERLRAAGAELVEAEIENLDALNAAVGFPVALYELTRDLPAYLKAAGYDLTLRDVRAGVGSPDVAAIIASQLGPGATSPAAYREAMQMRGKLQATYADHFRSHEVAAVVFPTAILSARPVGDDDTVELNGRRVPTFATFIRNTDPGSNAGIPGISLPAGLTAGGLPVGIELDGPAGSDRRLLAIAAAVERILPPLPAPPPA